MSCAPASCIGGDALRSAARSTAAQPCALRGQEEVCVAPSDITTSSSSLLGNDERRSEGPSSGRGEHGVRSRITCPAPAPNGCGRLFHFLCGTNFTAGRKNGWQLPQPSVAAGPAQLAEHINANDHKARDQRVAMRPKGPHQSCQQGKPLRAKVLSLMPGSAALSSVSRVPSVTWELKVTSIGCGPAATFPCLYPSVGLLALGS